MDPGPIDAVRVKNSKCLPTVLTKEDVKIVIAALSGVNALVSWLLYGALACD